MGLFKSEEDKAREEAERQAIAAEEEARYAAAEQEQAHQDWLSSPLGRATSAKEAGQAFFEVQLDVGRQEREAMWGTRDYASDERIDSSAELLEAIEKVGWTLEHVGYVFKMTGQSSTERMFVTGEDTAVSGVTVGIYLFRRTTGAPTP